MLNRHLVWEKRRKALSGKEDQAARDEYIRLGDLIAQTPAADIKGVFIQTILLCELIRPESLSPDDLEGALIQNICHALSALLS